MGHVRQQLLVNASAVVAKEAQDFGSLEADLGTDDVRLARTPSEAFTRVPVDVAVGDRVADSADRPAMCAALAVVGGRGGREVGNETRSGDSVQSVLQGLAMYVALDASECVGLASKEVLLGTLAPRRAVAEEDVERRNAAPLVGGARATASSLDLPRKGRA